jgi:hypothetical protein
VPILSSLTPDPQPSAQAPAPPPDREAPESPSPSSDAAATPADAAELAARPQADAPVALAGTRAGAMTALAVMAAGFLVMATQYVRRVSNNMWSDEEFSGWTAAIAHRLALGERIYEDFTLPIPPGSMAILAWIERAAGRPAFLHEVWVCAVCHLLMALLAYALVRPLASRVNSVMVAAGTLAIVMQLPKELAYDHTAQVVAWTSLVLLVRAWTTPSHATFTWLTAGAGLLGGLTFLFKQSTGTGVIGGALAALGYRVVVERWRGVRSDVRREIGAIAAFVAGGALGFGLTLAAVRALGGSVSGYLQTVFVDGPALKGGTSTLLRQTVLYTLRDPTVQISFVAGAVGVLIAWRVARNRGDFVMPGPYEGDEEARRGEQVAIPWRTVVWFALLFAGTFAVGTALLALRVKELPLPFAVVHGATRGMAPIGLLFAATYFAGNLRARRGPAGRPDALNALLIATLIAASVHNLSFPGVRFFYDNNTIVAVALLALFIALDQSRWAIMRYGVFAVLVVSLLGDKMARYVEAQTPAPNGFWGGMRVNSRGVEVLKAVSRIQELSSPSDTVLVLPEDVNFATLIPRPRPRLCGAILFVDQYPARCVAQDLALLEAQPPKVIVIHPRWKNEWQWVYRLWSTVSPAGFVNDAFLGTVIPRRYRLDSSYKTVWFGAADIMDVYVRRDDVLPEGIRAMESAPK